MWAEAPFKMCSDFNECYKLTASSCANTDGCSTEGGRGCAPESQQGGMGGGGAGGGGGSGGGGSGNGDPQCSFVMDQSKCVESKDSDGNVLCKWAAEVTGAPGAGGTTTAGPNANMVCSDHDYCADIKKEDGCAGKEGCTWGQNQQDGGMDQNAAKTCYKDQSGGDGELELAATSCHTCTHAPTP